VIQCCCTINSIVKENGDVGECKVVVVTVEKRTVRLRLLCQKGCL
jgi:hypothetical protein